MTVHVAGPCRRCGGPARAEREFADVHDPELVCAECRRTPSAALGAFVIVVFWLVIAVAVVAWHYFGRPS